MDPFPPRSLGANLQRRTVEIYRVCCLASVLLTACASYTSKPLDDSAILERLRGEPIARLTERAQQLRLPGAVSPVQIDENGAMNALGAAALAVIAQPNLRAARTRAGVAQAQLTAAGILPNPVLSAGVDVPILGGANTVPGLGLGLSWDITALLTRPENRKAAQAQVESVDLQIAWEEWQTAMAAQLSATRVAWLQVRVLAAETDTQLARDFAERLVHAAAQHAATSLDVDAAAAAAENATQRTVALHGQLDGELLALKRAIGLPSHAHIAVVEPTPLEPKPMAHQAELRDQLPVHRLDLLGLERAYASQDARLRAAVLSQFPRLALGLTAARDTGGVGTLGPGVAIDLPLFDRGQGRIALETASREQLFEVYLARRAEAYAELAKVLQDLSAAEQQLTQAAKVVDRLQKLAVALTLALEHRQADVVTVFAVRQQWMDARQNHLALAQLHAELRVALQAVIGHCRAEEP